MGENVIKDILDNLVFRYPVLNSSRQDIYEAYLVLEDCYKNNHKLLIAGNGGSAADADHIVGELMKGFRKKRSISNIFSEELKKVDCIRGDNIACKLQGALPAIALTNHVALTTAYSNDIDGLLCFAQQVYGYGNEGDILLAISTSGNSESVINSILVAKAKNMKIIGLTGNSGGELKKLSDVAITVAEEETYRIQELHLPIYHALCLMLEERFFAD